MPHLIPGILTLVRDYGVTPCLAIAAAVRPVPMERMARFLRVVESQ